MGKQDRSTFHARLKRMTCDLRKRIAAGEYGQGDFLPSELALAEQYKLSKNSVRVGLEQLLAEGLIVKIPRVGTQVAAGVETKPIKIRFGVYPSLYSEAEMERLIHMFHELNPHIQVETLELPYTSAESIRNVAALGIVDVLTVNLFNLYQLEESGSLDLFERQKPKEEVYPFLTQQFQFGTGLAAKPFTFSPVILCYNKEHLRERRLFEPDSGWKWDDVYETVRKLKAPNRYGMAFHLFSFNRWPLFLLQNGTRFVRQQDGSIVPLQPDGFRHLRQLRDVVHENGMFPLALSLGEVEAEKLFKEQKVSMILTTYYMLNRLKDVEFAYDIAQLPGLANNDTLLLSTGIAVNAQSRQKEAAQSLADFLSSDEAQAYLRKHTFSLPANKYISETIDVELAHKPCRLELHREIIPKYTTFRRMGLSMRELIALGDCIKQYVSYLIDEQGVIELFNEKLRTYPE